MKLFRLSSAYIVFNYIIGIAIISIVFTIIPTSDLALNYFSSDCLYIPSLARDIMFDQYKLNGWLVPGAPNFFPDLFIYCVILLIVKKIALAHFVFSILQYLFLMTLFTNLLKQFINKSSIYIVLLSNILFFVFFFVAIYYKRFYTVAFLPLSIGYHLGPFLMLLLCLIFTTKYLQNNRHLYLILIVVVGSLAVLSDMLFAIFYCVPMFLLIPILIKKMHKKKFILFYIAIALQIILGISVLLLLQTIREFTLASNYSILQFKFIITSFKTVFNQWNGYIHKYPVISVILILSITSLILHILYVVKEYKNFINTNLTDKKTITFFYFLFVILFSFVVFFNPLLNGNYRGVDCIRYNIFSYYILILNLPVVVLHISKKVLIQTILKLSGIFFCLIITVFIVIHFIKNEPIRKLRANINYYPPCAKCLDEYIRQNPGQYGLSSYWIAKVLTVFNKTDTRVYTVYSTMDPYFHASNKNWYVQTSYSKYSKPVFSFVFLEKDFNIDIIKSKFGNIIHKKECGDYVILQVQEFKFDSSTFQPYLINPSGK